MTIKFDEKDILSKALGKYIDTDRALAVGIVSGICFFAGDCVRQLIVNYMKGEDK